MAWSEAVAQLVRLIRELRHDRRQRVDDPVDEMIEHLQADPFADEAQWKQIYRRLRARYVALRRRRAGNHGGDDSRLRDS